MDGWSDAIYGEPDSKFEKFGFYFWKTLDLTWELNRTQAWTQACQLMNNSENWNRSLMISYYFARVRVPSIVNLTSKSKGSPV